TNIHKYIHNTYIHTPSIHLYIHTSIHPSIHPSIHTYIHPYIIYTNKKSGPGKNMKVV
ncbi:guanine nucleotide exchange factor subunit RIC1-like, partial [Mytilus californianus]|uniref:guanine nucleotide exchange factor subunit RIC1-like n=1 Tax=Mytilus californianus TaxID=6549 RepID=UPI002246F3D1